MSTVHLDITSMISPFKLKTIISVSKCYTCSLNKNYYK